MLARADDAPFMTFRSHGAAFIRTYYMNRVLDLPPLVSQAAYDAQPPRSRIDAPWMVTADGARLELRPPLRVTSGWRNLPYRAQRGTLVTRIHRWPVELELMPW